MEHVLDNEQLIRNFNLGYPPQVTIIDYYRLSNVKRHRHKFADTYKRLTNDVLYLNSTKHPGYVVFFSAKRKL